MNRTQYYNMRRAYRVISNRHEEHQRNWEDWMHDFPCPPSLRYPAIKDVVIKELESFNHPINNGYREDALRKILKRNVIYAIRNNLKYGY